MGDVSSNPHRVLMINICFSLIWNNQNSDVLKQAVKLLVCNENTNWGYLCTPLRGVGRPGVFH